MVVAAASVLLLSVVQAGPGVELERRDGPAETVAVRRSEWSLGVRAGERGREAVLEAWVPPGLRVVGLPDAVRLRAGGVVRFPFTVVVEEGRPPGRVEMGFVLRPREGGDALAEAHGAPWVALGAWGLRSDFEPPHGRRGRGLEVGEGWKVEGVEDEAAAGARSLRLRARAGSGPVVLWDGDGAGLPLVRYPVLVGWWRGATSHFAVRCVIDGEVIRRPLPRAGSVGWRWWREVLPESGRLERLELVRTTSAPGEAAVGVDELGLHVDGRIRPEDRLRGLCARFAAGLDDRGRREVGEALAGIPAGGLDARARVDHLLLGHALEWQRLDAALPAREPGQPASRERYEAMLRHRHLVDRDAGELVELGWRQVRRHQRELQELAEAIAPGRSWREVVDLVRADHPTAEELPVVARRAMADALAFTVREGLVTVPMAARHGRIRVNTDGPLSRTYPFGGYGGARRSPFGFTGTYFVSPPAVWMDEEEARARLRGNHRAWTRVVALHEMVPGHHLQTVVHAMRPLSPFRRRFYSTVMAEGWALYCEEMMFRAGYFPDAETRFTQLLMRLWRSVRVVIDASLHGGWMSAAEAGRLLVEEAALEEENARAEVRRYLDNPTRPMSYLVGYLAIGELERDARGAEGERFRVRRFRDRLLSFGPIPVAAIREGMGL